MVENLTSRSIAAKVIRGTTSGRSEGAREGRRCVRAILRVHPCGLPSRLAGLLRKVVFSDANHPFTMTAKSRCPINQKLTPLKFPYTFDA